VAGQGATCDSKVEARTDPVVHDGGTMSRRKIQAGKGREGERGRPAGEVQPAVVGGGQWQRSLGAVRCVMTAAGGCSPCDPVVACAEYEGVLHVIRS
jgi:hypothetical protein